MSLPNENMPTPGHEHDRRVGAAHRRGVGGGVAFVVAAVVVAIRGVQLAQPGDALVERCVGRQVEHERAHLGADEVVGARRAEPGEPFEVLAGEELEHDVVVGEVADHRPVGRGDRPHVRGERRGSGAPLARGQRAARRDGGAERLGSAVALDVRRRRCG